MSKVKNPYEKIISNEAFNISIKELKTISDYRIDEIKKKYEDTNLITLFLFGHKCSIKQFKILCDVAFNHNCSAVLDDFIDYFRNSIVSTFISLPNYKEYIDCFYDFLKNSNKLNCILAGKHAIIDVFPIISSYGLHEENTKKIQYIIKRLQDFDISDSDIKILSEKCHIKGFYYRNYNNHYIINKEISEYFQIGEINGIDAKEFFIKEKF